MEIDDYENIWIKLCNSNIVIDTIYLEVGIFSYFKKVQRNLHNELFKLVERSTICAM